MTTRSARAGGRRGAARWARGDAPARDAHRVAGPWRLLATAVPCVLLRPTASGVLVARLLGHHHLHELLVVDLAVAVDISLTDHLVNLLVRELLAEVRHHVAELSGGDEAVAVLVEHLERLLELLLGVRVLHLARHEGEELREVDRA